MLRTTDLTAYPTTTDLSNRLTALNLSFGTMDLTTYVNAGIEDFEAAVGRRMLAEGTVTASTTSGSAVVSVNTIEPLYIGENIRIAGIQNVQTINSLGPNTITLTNTLETATTGAALNEVRFYDPPSNYTGILITDDFCSLPTVYYQPLTSAEQLLVLNQDYTVEPVNNVSKGRPYYMLRMFYSYWKAPVSYNNMMLRNAVQIAAEWGYSSTIPRQAWNAMLARSISLLAGEISQGLNRGVTEWQFDRTRSMNDTGFRALAEGCDREFHAAVAAYRRVTYV